MDLHGPLPKPTLPRGELWDCDVRRTLMALMVRDMSKSREQAVTSIFGNNVGPVLRRTSAGILRESIMLDKRALQGRVRARQTR